MDDLRNHRTNPRPNPGRRNVPWDRYLAKAGRHGCPLQACRLTRGLCEIGCFSVRRLQILGHNPGRYDEPASAPFDKPEGRPVQAGRPSASEPTYSRLISQDHLPAKPPSLRRQSTKVDAAGASATLGVLSVPRQVVVAGLLVSAGERCHQLARDVVELKRDSGLAWVKRS
jgi:hypothetical protein